MPISVNTNVGALASMAASTSTSKALDTALTRLATGKRINTAGDDAAGIAISARLTSEVKGLGMAIKNALDGQGLIDTTEGAQAEVTNILQRMRELAVKAANDTNSASDRKNIDAEIQQLVIEVDRISSTTTWAGQKILHGANGLDVGAKTLSFQVGFMDEDSQKIDVSVLSTSSKTLDISATDRVVTLVSTPPSTGATNVAPFIDQNGGISLNAALLPAVFPATVAAGVAATRTNDTTMTFTGAATGAGTNKITLHGYTVDVPLVVGDTTVTAAAYATAITAAVIAGNLPAGLNATSSNAVLTLSMDPVANGSMGVTINGIAVSTTVETPVLPTTISNTSTGPVIARVSDTSLSVTTNSTGVGTVSFQLGGKDISVAVVNPDTAANIAAKIKAAIEADSSGLTATVTGSSTYTVSFIQSDAAILGNLSDAIRAAKVPGVYMTESTTPPGPYSIDKHVFAATTADEALSALTRIDNAITAVNDQRSALGAISNRLSYTVNNLTNIVTNLDMSRGRIEDADFALESANMARFQILQQASTAMLAQANAAKQDVLSLIK